MLLNSGPAIMMPQIVVVKAVATKNARCTSHFRGVGLARASDAAGLELMGSISDMQRKVMNCNPTLRAVRHEMFIVPAVSVYQNAGVKAVLSFRSRGITKPASESINISRLTARFVRCGQSGRMS